MMKINFVLAALVISNALFLVHIQHENRQLFTAIATESTVQMELNVEYKRLSLERLNLVTPDKIANNAQSVLQMRIPTLGVTEYVPRDPRELRDYEPQIPADVYVDQGAPG